MSIKMLFGKLYDIILYTSESADATVSSEYNKSIVWLEYNPGV